MVVSPALASLRVSWNQRLEQSETTLARGVRHCCSSSKGSIFFAGSTLTPNGFALRGVATRLGDLGSALFGLLGFAADDTIRDSSASLAADSRYFPIKSKSHTQQIKSAAFKSSDISGSF